jgi:hypothetical protein
MNCCENTKIAANRGHLDCLKKLNSEGCGWDSDTTSAAARTGHLECLKYLHSQGCEWNSNTTSAAAKGGHIECLKYAHENGAEWHEETTFYAAANDHLDCLLYCLDNDCPIDPETLDKLYTSQTNKNLLTNIKLRKILLHPRIKNDITELYFDFVKAIEEYEEYKNKVYTLVASETNLPTDVIKYEIIKYI